MTTKTTNSAGRTFTVRIVRKGDTYGRDRCLTHEDDATLVEFYDATYAGNTGFDAEGQFVARYYAETLLARDGNHALHLDFRVPAWTIDAEGMLAVTDFISDAVLV
jgi:hypothetical protein